MKTVYIFLAILFMCLSNAQNIYFPDLILKQKLITAGSTNGYGDNCAYSGLELGVTVCDVDVNNDGEISQTEALAVTRLFIQNLNITDLTGLEYFTNLIWLKCYENQISYINTAPLTQLIILECGYNNLSSLNLTPLINLRQFNCNFNQINSLNFNGLNNLQAVGCAGNQLTILDFSTNPNFFSLGCAGNNLNYVNLKNSKLHLPAFGLLYDDGWCGNPNLNYVCADDSEIANLQSYLQFCFPNNSIQINSNCSSNGLANEHFGLENNKIIFSPNPTKSQFNIKYSTASINAQLIIYDLTGKQLFEEVLSDNKGNLNINITNFATGIYVIVLKENGSITMQKKLIKE